MSQPDVSVVIVSDYAAGGPKAWSDFRQVFTALAAQDAQVDAEWLLCENDACSGAIPAEVTSILPDLRRVHSEVKGSYELKNAAVRAATAPIVALLDADCSPAPDWLGNAVKAMTAMPQVAVISGRTSYPARGLAQKILSLVSRSHVDRVRPGPTKFTSSNNSFWRREVYLAHPLPNGLGPFAGRIQSESLLRAGYQPWFDPSIHVTHDFEGWAMERDMRLNTGYGTVIARLHDSSMPQAWLSRLGIFAIPAFVAGKIFDSWRDCLRCASAFGVKWYEIPLALLGSIAVHLMEIPGMWRAFRGKTIVQTEYR